MSLFLIMWKLERKSCFEFGLIEKVYLFLMVLIKFVYVLIDVWYEWLNFCILVNIEKILKILLYL